MITFLRCGLLALLVLTPLASAATHVVAPTLGPGVDFTTIDAAITSSNPGDVILVRAGTYPSFHVDRGVKILADSGVIVGPSSMVAFIPSSQTVVLSGIAIQPLYSSTPVLSIHLCAGPVLLEGIVSIYSQVFLSQPPVSISIDGCTDVRMRACMRTSVSVQTSRLEITSSLLVGKTGDDGCYFGCATPQGQQGGPGLVCGAGSEVHVGATRIQGGEGGFAEWDLHVCPGEFPGRGGDGVQVSGGSLLLTGTGVESVSGGPGGDNESPCVGAGAAPPGLAIDNLSGTVLYSGVAMFGGTFGTLTHVTPADPCLVASGTGAVGTSVTFTVVGQPGDEARLRLGRSMVVEHLPFVFEDRLTVPLRSYQLGVLPSNGRATFTLTIPSTLPPGTLLVAQGSTSNPTETRLTQSAPITVH